MSSKYKLGKGRNETSYFFKYQSYISNAPAAGSPNHDSFLNLVQTIHMSLLITRYTSSINTISHTLFKISLLLKSSPSVTVSLLPSKIYPWNSPTASTHDSGLELVGYQKMYLYLIFHVVFLSFIVPNLK